MKEEMQLTNQLCFAIYNANRVFNRFYQQALAPFKLTYSQYLVLLSLWEKDGQTLHEMGDELKLNSNTLTPVLKRLENAGWLTRTRPQEDRRQLVIHLTEKGKESQALIYHELEQCIAKYHLSMDEYKAALALNKKLVADFDAEMGEA